MMYIVLTAMLALNVAAEVLEAFRVVDSSLLQTIETVEMKNAQVYASFDRAYVENPAKVEEWKNKSDEVRTLTEELTEYIWQLKERLVMTSGAILIDDENDIREDDAIFVNQNGESFRMRKEDDLNSPSEIMVTQKVAEELKNKIISYKEIMIGMISDEDTELLETILQELDTSDPPAKVREGGERKSWEEQYFENKPLIAVLTVLTKINIDITNAESHMINYLYSQIDAESFKFNKLEAQVIANSNLVLRGDEYIAEIFLAAVDTTQDPIILVNDQPIEIVNGKGIYRRPATSTGTFRWEGLIRYRTPSGIIQNYPFEQQYQVTEPGLTVSAIKMNVLYKGIENPVGVSVTSIPIEDLRVTISNGTITRVGNEFIAEPEELDMLGNTTISVYQNVNGVNQYLGESTWRVKQVPDPVAKIGDKSGGDITKEELLIQDGILAVMEDFDFELNFTITQFSVDITSADGFVNSWASGSNRFTAEQRAQFQNLSFNKLVYFNNIIAVGDDGSERELDPITFKIR